MGRTNAALLLLALCLLQQLFPPDVRGVLGGVAVLAVPLGTEVGRWFPASPARLLAATACALALVALAIMSPEQWCSASIDCRNFAR